VTRRTRLARLERQAEEAETQRLTAWVVAEYRLPWAQALEEVRAVQARSRADKVLYPEEWVPDADGMIDLEPHVRRLAAEYGLDADELLQDAARWIAEG
jgi:hypothetical protein